MIDTQQPEVAFALEMVRAAAQLARRVREETQVEGLTKGDLSPVTVADFAVQAVLGKALGERFPNSLLVGEESSDELRTDDGAEMLALVTRFVAELAPDATEEQVCAWIDHGAADPADSYWTVDPVDGTKGYMRGGHYAVALALVEQGQVQVGALGCPNLALNCVPEPLGAGSIQVAKRGEGTWCTSLDSGGGFRQLHVAATADRSQARLMRSFESGHTNVSQIDLIADHLGVAAEAVRMDSQAKYAVLASGGGELLFRLLSPKKLDYKEKIWDQAAGSIVLEEAGGRITDLKGQPLDFSQGRTLAKNTGVLASNGVLHDAGLEAIAAICGL